MTITDNGNGNTFIKRIRANSTAAQLQTAVSVGDYVEMINDIAVDGKRHYEVARMLKQIPTGSRFSMRLISPLNSGFGMI